MARTKGHYRKSTPVGRLRKHVEKIAEQAEIVRDRLVGWSASLDPSVSASIDVVVRILQDASLLEGHVDRLAEVGFVPPPPGKKVEVAVGDRVGVRSEHRARYESTYAELVAGDPAALDDLRVIRKIEGDKIVAQRGTTPVVGHRSHFRRVA